MRRSTARARGPALVTVTALLVLSVLVLSNYLIGAAVPSPVHPGAPLALHLLASPAAPSPLSRAGVHPATISCTPPPQESWLINNTTNPDYYLAYPYPSYAYQAPCQIADPTSGGAWHDEVHATYSSAVAGSALRWTVPITLPVDSGTGTQAIYTDFYVDEVVTGFSSSVDGQSLARIAFTPDLRNVSHGYHVVASVLALVPGPNVTNCAGSTTSPENQSLTWNGSYACEEELLNHGRGLKLAFVPGGDVLNVTFVGSQVVGSALKIWVNDTARSISVNLTLNTTNTKVGPLRPAFNSACPDLCVLNWTFPFGLGLAADLCYYGGCNSYSESGLNSTTPFTAGPAKYWTGSGYTGEYKILAPESASGACSKATNSQGSPVVIPCPQPAQFGYYPVLSFNGSWLNLGTTFGWTTQDWGGAQMEFQAVGGLTDDIPFFLENLTNSSRAGFLPPNAILNVTVTAQVLGTVPLGAVFLNYTLPNGAGANVTMARWGGNAANARYSATVPATGGNGIITYRVWATDTAGATLADPAKFERPLSVQRTGIPVFTLHFLVNAGNCGGIIFNGTLQKNNTWTNITAGNYSIQGLLCYPWIFGFFTSTRGISTPPTQSGWSVVTANGTVKGYWFYIRPNDTLTIRTNPSNCGTITLNKTFYPTANLPAALSLLDWKNYTISAGACAQFSFAGWTVSDPKVVSVLGDVLTLKGNGTLTANFLGTTSSRTLAFHTVPYNCGGILLRNVGYTNNESINLATGTSYPVAQDPCPHYGFQNFSLTSGLSIANGQLTMSNTGTITENNYPLTEVTINTNPAFCGDIRFDGTAYRNATVLNLSANTTHSILAEACTGYYFTGFQTSGGVHVAGNTATVNSSGMLEANFQKGAHPRDWVGFLTSPSACGAVVFGGVAYSNSQYTNASPFTSWSVSAITCQGFGFVGWSTSGGITIWGGTAYVNQSGSIKALFHPLAPLYLYTVPQGCGNISVAGTSYSNGAILYLPINYAVPLKAIPCTGYGFAGWHNTTDALISHNTVSLGGASIITAVFTLLRYTILFEVTPATCGGIGFGSEYLFNNTTRYLTVGLYPITAQPCVGDYLQLWNVTGALNVVDGNLSVGGSGIVQAVYGPTPPSVSLSAPTSSYANSAIEFVASILVPVPPYTYSYDWTFGDGVSATTPANFTTHQYGHPGIYHVHVLVHDPYGRMASANVTVQVTPAPLLAGFAFTLIDGVLIGVVVAVLVAVVIAARWGRGSRPPVSSGTSVRRWTPPASGGGSASSFPNVDDPSSLPLDAPPAEPSNFEETV